MNDSIQTYIDAYDHLRIEVAKYFYSGECNEFYISKDFTKKTQSFIY